MNRLFYSSKSFTVDSIKPSKYDGDKHWTVTADLRGLETFGNCESNYDVVERLEKNKVLTKSAVEDSEYSQFFAYFKTKTSADNFLEKLKKYVEVRKTLINSL